MVMSPHAGPSWGLPAKPSAQTATTVLNTQIIILGRHPPIHNHYPKEHVDTFKLSSVLGL